MPNGSLKRAAKLKKTADFVEPASKKTKHEVDVNKKILSQEQLLTSHFWNDLTLGAHVPPVPVEIHENRPLFKAFRSIYRRIHANCISHVKDRLGNYKRANNLPGKSEICLFMREMCEKTLKFRENKEEYKFYTDDMMNAIAELFQKPTVELPLDLFAPHEHLRQLLSAQSVPATEKEVEIIRNALLSHFYTIAVDLIPFLLITELKGTYVVIKGFRSFQPESNKAAKPVPESVKTECYVREMRQIPAINPAQPPKSNKTTKTQGIPEMLKLTKSQIITGEGAYWKCLQLHGPYSQLVFREDVLKNRPLCNIIRLIYHRIHENCVVYLNRELWKYEKRKGPVKEQEVLVILREMCEKVMKIELKGTIYKFYGKKVMNPIILVFKTSGQFISIPVQSVLQQLQSVCKAHLIEATDSEMISVQKVLSRQFYNMAAELISFLLITKEQNNMLIATSYRPFQVQTPSMFTKSHAERKLPLSILHNLSKINNKLYSRNTPNTLWTSIPCEESDHLLEHVLDYGLIQVLPENVKKFLTEWMIGVRTRMRDMLKGRELESIVKGFFAGVQVPFEFQANDPRLETFIMIIGQKVLNSGSFSVSEAVWEKYVRNVKITDTTLRDPNTFFATANAWKTGSKTLLAALFSKSPTDQMMLFHTTAQLLRFFVMFSCNSIRHVFHPSRTGHFIYNGVMADSVTDFEEIEKYEKALLIQLGVLPIKQELPVTPPTLVKTPVSTVKTEVSSPPEQKFQPEQEQASTSSPEVPESVPGKRSSASIQVKQEPNLSEELSDEELNSARATEDREIDEDAEIPEKWRKMYKLLVQSDIELRDQRNRIERQFNYFCR